MKALIFFLIQFLGILKCNSQNTGELSSPEAGKYKSIDQTAGGLNDAGLKAPSELLIEPVVRQPPGMDPPPPPPPQSMGGFSTGTVGNSNQGSNIQISYPKLIPTPTGASYPQPGESPIVNVNSGGTVIKEWLPTNVQELLNLPKENTGLNANSFQPIQQSLEYPVPAKQVTNVFGNQAKGATLLKSGAYMLPGKPKSSNPSTTKNTAGVFVDGSLGAGSQNNPGTDSMDSYFYNEAVVNNRLPSHPSLNLNEAPSIQNVKNFLEAEKKVLASAYGMVNQGLPPQGTGPDYIPTPSEIPNDCNKYQQYRRNRKYYMERVNGNLEIRPCPPGTLYNDTVCSCSDMLPAIATQNKECRPLLHATFQSDFNDQTGNTKISNDNTQLVNGHAYLNGKNATMILWKYSSFDFMEKMTIQFRFKPDYPHHLYEAQPLLINCQIPQFLGPMDERKPPSIAIVLNKNGRFLTFFLMTKGHAEPQDLALPIYQNDWNNVKLSYNGSKMYAEVNGVTKSRRVKGKIENPHAPLTIGHCHRYGWFKGLIDDVYIYGQCNPNFMTI